MITFETGKYSDIVSPRANELFRFCIENTDADYNYVTTTFNRSKTKDVDVNILLAYVDGELAGFYSWASIESSSGASLVQSFLEQNNYSPSEVYVPLLVIVGKKFRRQGLGNAMGDKSAELAKAQGFRAKIYYFFHSNSLYELSKIRSPDIRIESGMKDPNDYNISLIPL